MFMNSSAQNDSLASIGSETVLPRPTVLGGVYTCFVACILEELICLLLLISATLKLILYSPQKVKAHLLPNWRLGEVIGMFQNGPKWIDQNVSRVIGLSF